MKTKRVEWNVEVKSRSRLWTVYHHLKRKTDAIASFREAELNFPKNKYRIVCVEITEVRTVVKGKTK